MQVILRHCPICSQDSIVGHGRRRKQAHDQHHDWIGIRRGLCSRCGKTFTFLPPFSPPYGHYSFIARSQALQRRFLEGRSWEAAAPTVKDPDRVADPSTLRRWCRSLDSSQPPFSFLRETIRAVGAWLSVATLPMVFGFSPECRSASLRNSVRLRRNPQSPPAPRTKSK